MLSPEKPATNLLAFVRQTFSCSAETASSIVERAKHYQYRARTILLKQGEEPNHTCLLVHGLAHVIAYGPAGQVAVLHEFCPGDFFGAVNDPFPDTLNSEVIAVQNTELAVFAALEFLFLLERFPCVGLVLSKSLVKHLRQAARTIAQQTTLSATGRICAEVSLLSQKDQKISPPPVLSSLAIRLNTTRETVSRTISALERRGILRRTSTEWIVVSPRQLEELII